MCLVSGAVRALLAVAVLAGCGREAGGVDAAGDAAVWTTYQADVTGVRAGRSALPAARRGGVGRRGRVLP
jgi:hypothetical protein